LKIATQPTKRDPPCHPYSLDVIPISPKEQHIKECLSIIGGGACNEVAPNTHLRPPNRSMPSNIISTQHARHGMDWSCAPACVAYKEYTCFYKE